MIRCTDRRMSLFLKIAIALPKDCHHVSDTTFDLLFLRGGIHGDALTEVGRCNDLTSSISLLSLVVGSSTSSTKLMKEKKKKCTCPIHAS